MSITGLLEATVKALTATEKEVRRKKQQMLLNGIERCVCKAVSLLHELGPLAEESDHQHMHLIMACRGLQRQLVVYREQRGLILKESIPTELKRLRRSV